MGIVKYHPALRFFALHRREGLQNDMREKRECGREPGLVRNGIYLLFENKTGIVKGERVKAILESRPFQ